MSLWTTLQLGRAFGGAVGKLPVGHLWYLLRRMRNERPHRFGRQVRINTFFPPYPAAAFNRFLGLLIRRQRAPFSTYLAVTSECPCRCAHCSYGQRAPSSLPTNVLLDLIRQARELGACTLGFTGGEPLLRSDLEELVAAASGAQHSSVGVSPDMATIVFTSGHGLSAARAAALAQAGLTCLTIGVESDDADRHDQIRGVAGSFGQVQSAARIARDAGLYLALSTIGTRQKIHSGELERMCELAAAWGASEFRLLAPVATGSALGCGSSFMLNGEERQALYDFHVRHNRARRGPAVASFAYLESAEVFGCGAGYHHLYIDAAGEVCPCDLTPLSFGNATERSLAEIWSEMGQYFPRPRCSCLMGTLGRLDGCQAPGASPTGGTRLPLPPETSRLLCPHRQSEEPLPQGYRWLLGRR